MHQSQVTLMRGHSAPLIFLQVPKTAGVTLTNLVLRHFRSNEIYLTRGDVNAAVARLKALPEAARMRIRCLKGHQAFGLHEYLAPGARYITMLREPVARIASHYEFVRKRPEHYMHPQLVERNIQTLADYATSRITGELHNGQTRLLAGVWDDRPLDEAHLVQAIANLEQHFDWIGLMERFDESVVMLALHMRWANVLYRVSNVGARWRASSLDPEVSRLIEQENTLDMQLYEYAVRRFDRIGRSARVVRSLAARGLSIANQTMSRLQKR
ncbi:MAG: sulfotransferase family 2 domain-containing protein [Pseudomonadota bacterium]